MNEKQMTLDTAKKLLDKWRSGHAWLVVDNPICLYGEQQDTLVLTNVDNPYDVLSRAGGERETLRDKESALRVLTTTCVKCYVYDKDEHESKYVMTLAPSELSALVEQLD